MSLKNADDVAYLHKHVNDDLKWKQKMYELVTGKNLRTGELTAKNKELLPNLIFETVGKSNESLLNIIGLLRPLGYKIKIVWVVTDVDAASNNNQKRSRTVNTNDLYKSHVAAY